MDGENTPCKWCDKGWAAIGFLFGALVIFVSIDLMTDGRITEAFTRSTVAETVEESAGDE